jgi:parallel beta helix pectate lyase-like protein
MTAVTVNQYDKNGITCDDNSTQCTISGSSVTGLGPIPASSSDPHSTAQNGIQVWGANASISTSVVSGNSYTAPLYPNQYFTASGILVINAGTLTLSHNTVNKNDANIYALWTPGGFGITAASQGTWSITNNTAKFATNNTGTSGATAVPSGDGFGDGIDLDGVNTQGGTATVSGNTVTSGAEYGIGLFDTTGAQVSSNHTNTNLADGIYVGDNPFTGSSGIAANPGASTGNTVSSNTADSNHGDGILADVTAQDSSNSFTSNGLAHNLRYDAEDLSSGGGTGGTANTWSANVCQPSTDGNPEAICTAP